jgi:hypothetical protein
LPCNSSFGINAIDLQLYRKLRCSPARLLVALAVACALVVVGFLAVSPKAHACVHAHHQAPDHDCFAKHFADGKVLLTVLDAPAPGLAALTFAAPVPPPPLFLPADFRRLPAGRAPPMA